MRRSVQLKDVRRDVGVLPASARSDQAIARDQANTVTSPMINP